MAGGGGGSALGSWGVDTRLHLLSVWVSAESSRTGKILS